MGHFKNTKKYKKLSIVDGNFVFRPELRGARWESRHVLCALKLSALCFAAYSTGDAQVENFKVVKTLFDHGMSLVKTYIMPAIGVGGTAYGFYSAFAHGKVGKLFLGIVGLGTSALFFEGGEVHGVMIGQGPCRPNASDLQPASAPIHSATNTRESKPERRKAGAASQKPPAGQRTRQAEAGKTRKDLRYV